MKVSKQVLLTKTNSLETEIRILKDTIAEIQRKLNMQNYNYDKITDFNKVICHVCNADLSKLGNYCCNHSNCPSRVSCASSV